MANQSKEPMIGKSNRPTTIDYDTPLSELKVRDLLGILSAHTSEQSKTHLEFYKPEYYKEWYKPEYYKPEAYKPDLLKEHKETVKEKQFVPAQGGESESEKK